MKPEEKMELEKTERKDITPLYEEWLRLNKPDILETIFKVVTVIVVIIAIGALVFALNKDAENRQKKYDFTLGYTQIGYCYDYVDENNYEIIKPKESEELYVDDFGKVYIVKCSYKGLRDINLEKIEVKSKHENGVILAFSSNRVICPCNTTECPHQTLKQKFCNK